MNGLNLSNKERRLAELRPLLQAKYLNRVSSPYAAVALVGCVEAIKHKRGAGLRLVLRLEHGLAELFVPDYIAPMQTPVTGDWLEAEGYLVPEDGKLAFCAASIVTVNRPYDDE